MSRLRLLVVASLATVSLGCAVTWKEYRDSRGAGKADTEVAIFKAHLENTRRIVSASDGRLEYQYDPAQIRTPGFTAHPLVRLLPGQYTVTAKTWPFGSLNEFEVDLKAGHKYEVETSLCSMQCTSIGKPYRHDRWIQDLTTRERISDVVSECYRAKTRRGERRRVPCPDEEDHRDFRDTDIADAEVATVEEDHRDSSGAGKAKARVTTDEEGNRESRDADKADAEVATVEEDHRESRDADIADAEVATVEEDHRDSRDADKPDAGVTTDEEVNRDSRGSGNADAVVATFMAHLENTRRIVSTSDERIEYEYNPKQKRTKQPEPPLIQLQPGQYTITAKTWPFGSLYEFEVDLKAGHIYEVQTYLCSLKCISTGKPNRHDYWIQDLTTAERISGIVSECYLGKKRRRDRRRVPCLDDE